MSFQAMAWAVNQPEITPTSKLILIILANYADEKSSCFPSREHISKLANCDERTVRRSIKQLQDQGLISISERFTEEGRQTSNRYILRVAGMPEARGTNLSPTRETSRPPIQSKETIKGNKYTDEFQIFWNFYPRKSGSKRKASILYDQIVNKHQEIDARSLLQVVRVFAEANEKSDQKFIPHASTWLYQRRFETNVHFVDEKRKLQISKIQSNKNQLAG